MSEFRELQKHRDDLGVVTVRFDVRDSPVNVFNETLMGELAEVVSLLESNPPRAVLFRSAKASGFFAGADVHHIRHLATPADAAAVQSIGQGLFDRIERLSCPTIAAIHGVCLGGGLELALACKHRVARDDTQTRLGLPEVQLGLIPGWGGTFRLPRLVGLRQALGVILEGKTVTASRAATIGLVDRAIAPDEFDAGVKGFVEDVLTGRSGRRPPRGLSGMLLDGTTAGRALVLATAEKRAHRRGRHYPALAAAIRSVRAGLRRGHDGGLAAEREEFPRLLFGPVADNLIDLFLNREKARKTSTWVTLEHTPRKVQRAVVVGAGVMGAGIAQLLALNDIQVVLRDINAELTAAGMKRVEDLTREAEKKGAISATEAAAAIRNVTPTPDLDALTGCSLVIEAVVEREDIKQKVFRDLTERLGADVMLATNTSALSVSRIAQAVQRPGRVAGLHFFNPVHRMPLVEVVRGRDTNDATIASLVELVRKVGKVPVVVADSPGFLVNRILFPYMDEAVRLVLEGVPGEVVDREAVQFGMPMGPLELLDQVGIDIAADVAKTFAGLRSDLGPTPARFAQMVTDGALGKKAGRGFYTYRNDKRGAPTRWATMAGKPIPRTSKAEVGGLSEIERRLIYPMINEAAKCLDAGVVAEPWMVDIAMVLGTGFAPFRGGPLHTADSLGIARVVQEMEGLRKTQGERFEPAALLRRMASESQHFYPQPRHALTAT